MAEREHLIRMNAHQPGYAEDYAAWIDAQVMALRAGRFADVDVANLVDEVESLGRSDYRRLVSAIEIVLIHLLKWDHQPERRSASWVASVAEHRQRIIDELADSPSYKARLEEATERAYRTARPAAAKETGLAIALFPSTNSYGWADITGRALSLDA